MNGLDRTPFDEDTAAHQVARALGFEITRRYNAIDITDEKALIAAGWGVTQCKPDYARISKALGAGQTVDGARFRSMEYILRPRALKEAD